MVLLIKDRRQPDFNRLFYEKLTDSEAIFSSVTEPHYDASGFRDGCPPTPFPDLDLDGVIDNLSTRFDTRPSYFTLMPVWMPIGELMVRNAWNQYVVPVIPCSGMTLTCLRLSDNPTSRALSAYYNFHRGVGRKSTAVPNVTPGEQHVEGGHEQCAKPVGGKSAVKKYAPMHLVLAVKAARNITNQAKLPDTLHAMFEFAFPGKYKNLQEELTDCRPEQGYTSANEDAIGCDGDADEPEMILHSTAASSSISV